MSKTTGSGDEPAAVREPRGQGTRLTSWPGQRLPARHDHVAKGGDRLGRRRDDNPAIGARDRERQRLAVERPRIARRRAPTARSRCSASHSVPDGRTLRRRRGSRGVAGPRWSPPRALPAGRPGASRSVPRPRVRRRRRPRRSRGVAGARRHRAPDGRRGRAAHPGRARPDRPTELREAGPPASSGASPRSGGSRSISVRNSYSRKILMTVVAVVIADTGRIEVERRPAGLARAA